MTLNFRNVVVGSPSRDLPFEEWPKLGEINQPQGKFRSNVHDEEKSQANLSSRSDDPEPKTSLSELDCTEFPALDKSRVFKSKPSVSQSKLGVEDDQKAKKSKRRKLKKSSPLLVDICEIIQASALQKKQKRVVQPLKKSTKIKRKIIGGNHLDADQPLRHKGKVRPWKPRYLSKTKKTFYASRQIRLPKSSFSRDVIEFKEHFGSALKRGKLNVDELVKNLTGISLTEDGGTSESAESITNKIAKDVIHNKKFRSYCTNLATQELKKHAGDLVVSLRKFQDRLHAKDEIKAHAKRRYVCGFNESKKFLLADRVKLLLVATNLEMEEGLPSMSILQRLIDAATERTVPVIYAGLGQNIGYWSLKKAKISVLAVINFEGAKEAHDNLIKSWTYAKEEYYKLFDRIVQICTNKLSDTSNAEEVKMSVEEEIKEVILIKLKE